MRKLRVPCVRQTMVMEAGQAAAPASQQGFERLFRSALSISLRWNKHVVYLISKQSLISWSPRSIQMTIAILSLVLGGLLAKVLPTGVEPGVKYRRLDEDDFQRILAKRGLK